MDRITLSLFFYLSVLTSSAQQRDKPEFLPSDYFNNFQRFVNQTPNQEAALVNVRKLAAISPPVAAHLIHNSFAQDFYYHTETDEKVVSMRMKRRMFAKDILTRLSVDTSETLVRMVRPISIYVEIQESKSDLDRLDSLTNRFIALEIEKQDVYVDRAGRYGLLIVDIISKFPRMRRQTQQLIDILTIKLREGQVVATDSSTKDDLDKRAWYRYLNACLHFKKYELTSNLGQRREFLRTAFEYSPDLVDKNHKPAYFYDMRAIFGKEKDGFKEDYLVFISGTRDRYEVLETLKNASLVDPSFKKNLRDLHSEVMAGENFVSFWRNAIDSAGTNAPIIALNLIDKGRFSSNFHKGKWILLDFWGTWCGPCRAEHPDVQKFYESTVEKNTKTLTLLTIACRDNLVKVDSYMKGHRYTFPVAMSDGKIEKKFNVQGYPTKVLITPSSKYITIPYGADWVSFVNNYIDNQ